MPTASRTWQKSYLQPAEQDVPEALAQRRKSSRKDQLRLEASLLRFSSPRNEEKVVLPSTRQGELGTRRSGNTAQQGEAATQQKRRGRQTFLNVTLETIT